MSMRLYQKPTFYVFNNNNDNNNNNNNNNNNKMNNIDNKNINIVRPLYVTKFYLSFQWAAYVAIVSSSGVLNTKEHNNIMEFRKCKLIRVRYYDGLSSDIGFRGYLKFMIALTLYLHLRN